MEIINSSSNKIIKLKNRKSRCPTCKKYSLPPLAPFCSKKCSDKDLIKWLLDENSIEFNSN